MNRILLTLAFMLPMMCPVGISAYEIYIVTPAVNDYLVLTKGPLPPTCRLGNTLDIMASRGEYEPASFVIETKTGEHLDNVRIHCGPLQSATSELPIGAVDIRLVDRFNIGGCIGMVEGAWHLVYDQGMIEATDDTVAWVAAMTEEEFEKSSEHIVKALGSCGYPPTLAEYQSLYKVNRIVRAADAKSLRPIQVDSREQVWLTVHVPQDAPAGHYEAKVRVAPGNAPATVLTLQVWVPDIDLEEPIETYSIYYPTWLTNPQMRQDFKDKYFPISEAQMVLELENMMAHGCTNPNIYGAVGRLPDGSLTFDSINRILDLREQAGLPKGELFMSDGAVVTDRPLKPGHYERNLETIPLIQAWATERGYGQVFFTAADEASGKALLDQYETWESIEEAGAGVWVATPPSWHELVLDVLAVPIVAYPGMIAMNNTVEHKRLTSEIFADPKPYRHGMVEKAMTVDWQNIIAMPHKRGFRFFQYFDGYWFPGEHRRVRGFGMWLTNVDGTMNWSYHGIGSHGRVREAGETHGNRNYVMRVKGGVLDTLKWEAYREGYDDSRYIATLLSFGGEEWLEAIPHERIFNGNLDELRRELAEEILRLQGE